MSLGRDQWDLLVDACVAQIHSIGKDYTRAEAQRALLIERTKLVLGQIAEMLSSS